MAVQAYQLNGWRESLAVSFFRLNEVTTPARITTFSPAFAGKQPVITTFYFHDPNIAKPNVTPDPDKSAFSFGSYNVN